MVRTLAAITAAVLLVGPARGQEAITVKVRDSAQGDKSLEEVKDEGSFQVTVTDDKGNVLKEQKDQSGKHLVYRQTILEKPAGGRATRVRRQYDRAEETVKGQKRVLPYQGKAVLIEKKGDRYAFRIEGGAELTGQDAEALDREFNKRTGLTGKELQELVLPTKPVRVGDSWRIDPAQFAKELARASGLVIDDTASKGTGTLTKAYRKDGRQFGVIDLTLEMVPRRFSQDQKVLFQPGAKLVLQVRIDACIDGTSSTGAAAFRMTLAAEALLPSPNQPMFTMRLAGQGGGEHRSLAQ